MTNVESQLKQNVIRDVRFLRVSLTALLEHNPQAETKEAIIILGQLEEHLTQNWLDMDVLYEDVPAVGFSQFNKANVA